MTDDALRDELLGYVRARYPDMAIAIAPWERDPSRLAITFTDPAFAPLYAVQRWHKLVHLFPRDFHDARLADTVWYPLVPGESPEDLQYPDDELVANIEGHVMKALDASGAIAALDERFCPTDAGAPRARCHGDYRIAREVFSARGFDQQELFDIFHVLMAHGGHCDCEILYNAVESSRLKGEYWTARAEGREPRTPHSS